MKNKIQSHGTQKIQLKSSENQKNVECLFLINDKYEPHNHK